MRKPTAALLTFVLGASVAGVARADCSVDPAAAEPTVVVALIDTGINPYSLAFRDDGARAQRHPCTYIEGYPETAMPLDLSLDARGVEAAIEADRSVWESVFSGQLYYVPGTKIVGAISLGSGGTGCREPGFPPPASLLNGLGCEERTILDDHGHGTMTASRATSFIHSLGSNARVVMIEGLGTGGVAWASDQGWIDVQSNSWGSLVPGPSAGTSRAIRTAAAKHMVLFASGNGLGGFQGWGPWPTYIEATGAPGAILVGGHDNGRVSHWSNAPAHVVADAYGGWTGLRNALDVRPEPMACCTSAASPYAAGGAAAIAFEARRILGDTRTGVRNGVVAEGTPPASITSGPLADGVFTLDEWKRVFLATAEARPGEGADDGLLHFTGGARVPQHPEHGPGENPFCQGCWTLPLRWSEWPQGVPAYPLAGYGAINERSVALAADVLRGAAPLPARAEEDEFFAQDEAIRRTIFGS